MSTKHRERNAAVCFADAFDTIGLANGNAVGGMVGLVDGAGLTGDRDGALECDVVGFKLGDVLGDADSFMLGDDEKVTGDMVGEVTAGDMVGEADSGALGDDEGAKLGSADGDAEGDADGCDVG